MCVDAVYNVLDEKESFCQFFPEKKVRNIRIIFIDLPIGYNSYNDQANVYYEIQ